MSPLRSISGRSLGKLLEGFKTSTLGQGFGSDGSSTVAVGGVSYLGGNIYHVFVEPGNFVLNTPKTVDYIVVGGGGGGGCYGPGGGAAGGAGAGGVLYGSILLSAGTYPVVVGQGGAGGDKTQPTPDRNGTPGGHSQFHTIRAEGGGHGGYYSAQGGNGGSGGGSSYGGGIGLGNYVAGTNTPATPGQGYNGNGGTTWVGGGGGGAGGDALADATANGAGGTGGPGLTIPGWSADTIYDNAPSELQTTLTSSWKTTVRVSGFTIAGGGSGGIYSGSTGPVKGATPGGGGAGAWSTDAAGDGVIYTGSGGGGAENSPGGAGGHGIVLIKY